MLARDVMTTTVISVSPDATVTEIARMMLSNRISAVPVIDGDRRVLGIVSEGDLMRRPENETEPPHSWWLDLLESAQNVAAEYVKTHGPQAADVMTRPAVTVPEDMPVRDIAELLEKRRIKRVPVVRDDKLVGIVSRANLLQALATYERQTPQQPRPEDREIRRRISEEIDRELSGRTSLIDLTVVDGLVTLWGIAESEPEREAVRIIAENVPGVAGVANRVNVLPPHIRGLIWAE